MSFSLRKFDVLPKLDNEYRIGTTTGGILSICSIFATIILSYVEISAFLHPPIRQRLVVDSVRPTELDGYTISYSAQPRLDIYLSIVFPRAPCYLLHFDVLDPITQLPLPLDEVESNFTRISDSGEKVGDYNRGYLTTEPVPGCGSCYLEGSEQGKCCNSCQEVFAAFEEKTRRPPSLIHVDQCKEVVNRLRDMDFEGCHIQSRFRAVRVGGEFHIAPGMSWFNEGWHVHDIQTFGKLFDDVNLSHYIERLQFSSADGPMPLDSSQQLQTLGKAWRVVYTADVLADNFSVSRYAMYEMGNQSPGVVFKYDVSPIMATTYLDREPVMHLLTRLLTVIGGVLGMFRLVDALVYYSHKRKRQDQIEQQ
jgi:hypothetical protein